MGENAKALEKLEFSTTKRQNIDNFKKFMPERKLEFVVFPPKIYIRHKFQKMFAYKN